MSNQLHFISTEVDLFWSVLYLAGDFIVDFIFITAIISVVTTSLSQNLPNYGYLSICFISTLDSIAKMTFLTSIPSTNTKLFHNKPLLNK